MKPGEDNDDQEPLRGLNWTTIGLVAGLILLMLVVAYFATRGNSDQDKLTNVTVAEQGTPTSPSPEKLCASKATYNLIKRELFRRAAQLRGSDQAAFDRLSGYAVVRMENPVMESQDNSTGAVHCSGSLSLDLPPGVAAVGGRRTMTSDIDYTVQQAADGSGPVVLLQNADSIITPLATLAKVGAPPQEPTQPVPIPGPTPGTEGQPAAPAPTPPATTDARGGPSFSCANARTHGEIAVCGDPGLAALDRQMAAQYSRAIAGASPEQRAILQRTRNFFLGYRDRCPNNSCIGDAYVGRMREIRDIMEGRSQPRR